MAKKNNTIFVCDNCGESTINWMGKCPSCGSWNSLKPFTEPSQDTNKSIRERTSTSSSSDKASLTPLKKIKTNDRTRISTNIDELNRVLGGGIVQGSVILIGGEPGIGKSTLLLQTASNIAKNEKVYYFTGEESLEQIKLRADRLTLEDSDFLISSESNCDNIINTLLDDTPSLAIIDSIQTIYSPSTNSIAGSPAQIKNCAWALMQTAKLKNITIFLVGHITKEGTIAGPKILEHIVDCVLYFEGDDKGIYRILRAVKNRYGAVDEVGIFEMAEKGLMEVKDPSRVFTRGVNETVFAGNVVTPVIEGSRVFCVEQEALVGSSAFGYPRRLTIGYDQYRLLIIIAILEKRAHLNLSNQDVYINVANGLNVKDTASDLAIAMAIASSMSGISIQRTTAYIGELGLSGEVRPVRFIERRIKEMQKFSLKEVYISKRAVKEIKNPGDIKIIGIDHISEAVKRLGIGN
ncbi:DNA repair protein RadA [Brachyspira hyodysenteriae]|uniref:DNA repair protein RadA n=1 Tax=Brachyspira hyodysenteriae TaxID=159 RepID=UPI001ADDBA6C|nr:DNA repair protein RadA [Brachyspira hyodysenteriae]QTM05327.1 DNA repair protein RadA [Brachyspira hyodysenteriae]